MKLVWFEINGYKRFADLTKINLDGKLVAIVGPNEAGKTSLLRCMNHFNHTEEFLGSGGSQEITRGKEVGEDDRIAEWTFAIDAEDRELLSDIPEAGDLRWYVIYKHKNGEKFHRLTPHPKRSLDLRKSLITEIQSLCDTVIASDSTADESNDNETDNDLTISEEVALLLEKDDESLSDDAVKMIADLADHLESDEDLTHGTLVERLRKLHEYESLETPTIRVRNVLASRKPAFLFFGDDDRNLLSEYDLNSFFLEENISKNIRRSRIPLALANLAKAADLDLEDLHDAQNHDDRGRVKTVLRKAEQKISQILEKSWTQSKLYLSLELDGWRLQILLKSEKGDYVKVVERSDGLRQFLALLLFLSRQPKSNVKPIVLIDEAESHLHYDAQADLVQMLATQDLAAKVIYTTHSIGCLPEDLGSGVRMVSANDPHSSVENWFWDTSRPGFSPLLFAMGANTLAFMPMRYAVVGEGAADMILVPAILKEGLGRDSLGFQVVPGLSSGTSVEIAIIDNEAARTAYLCDGDKAGRRLKLKAQNAGVTEDKILTLPGIDGEETVIEDYVLIDSYLCAVNEELQRSGCEDKIVATDLQRPNRPKQLEKWCKGKGVSIPSKRAVAYHIIENKYESPIIDPDITKQVEVLHSLITKSLDLPLK